MKSVNSKLGCDEDRIQDNLDNFRKDHKFMPDLLSPRTNALIGNLDYEGKKRIYFKKLQNLVEIDPEIEVYLPVVYFPYSISTSKRSNRIFAELLISNKGNIFNLKYFKKMKCSLSTHKYKVYGLSGYAMLTHRMVASTWIPKPESLNVMEYSELEVNHLNGVKDDPRVVNLEWCTPQQNKLHAKKTGLLITHSNIDHPTAIPMKGTVIDIPEHKGKKIFVCGREDCLSVGISNKVLYKIRSGSVNTYRGCKWEPITKEEFIRDYKKPDEGLLAAVKAYDYKRTGKKSNRSDKVVWELTHVRTGNVKYISGTIEMKRLGFECSNMHRQLRLGKPYKNYWVRPIRSDQ